MKEEIMALTNRGTLLRPAAVFPIEIYSDERIAEFSEQYNEFGAFLGKL